MKQYKFTNQEPYSRGKIIVEADCDTWMELTEVFIEFLQASGFQLTQKKWKEFNKSSRILDKMEKR